MRVGVVGHRHRGAAVQFRKPVTADLRPRHALVRRLEQVRAARPPEGAARRRTRRHVVLVGGGQDHVRLVVRVGQLHRADLIVHVEHLGPRPAAVGAAEHAPLVALGVDVALRRHHHDVRVRRVDDDRRDLLGGVEPHVLPGAPGVGGLVDAVPLVDRAAGDDVAGADVDDVRVRRRHFHGAHRRHVLHGIEDRSPGDTGVGGLPHPGRRRAEVEHARLADGARDRGHAPGAQRSDVAPDESGEHLRLHRRARADGQQGSGGEPDARPPAVRQQTVRHVRLAPLQDTDREKLTHGARGQTGGRHRWALKSYKDPPGLEGPALGLAVQQLPER